jgi:hypothetical protein
MNFKKKNYGIEVEITKNSVVEKEGINKFYLDN